TSIANQSSHDRANWSWCATELCAIDRQPIDGKGSESGRQIDACVSATCGPGKGSTMNSIGIVYISVVNRIIDVEGRDYTLNIFPADNIVVVAEVPLLRERCSCENQHKHH